MPSPKVRIWSQGFASEVTSLSKSLAGSGGFVAGNSQIITYLRHHARGYIFSGALPSVYANVAIAAIDLLRREEVRERAMDPAIWLTSEPWIRIALKYC